MAERPGRAATGAAPRRMLIFPGILAVVLIVVAAAWAGTEGFGNSPLNMFGDSSDDDDEVEYSSVTGGADSGEEEDGTGDYTDDGDGTEDGGGGTDAGDDADNDGWTSTGERRVVLVEDFTNTGCPPCKMADPEFDATAEMYGKSKVAYVRYHVWWPEAGDPFYQDIKGEVEDRTSLYAVSAVPSVFADGGQVPLENADSFDDYGDILADSIEEHRTVEPVFDIRARADLPDGAEFATLEVELTQLRQTGSGSHLFALLVEDDIRYDASNGESVHNYIVRRFITDGDGVDLDPDAKGEDGYRATFSVPGKVDTSSAYVVVFIQKEDGTKVHGALVAGLA